MQTLTLYQTQQAMKRECPICGAPPSVGCIKMSTGAAIGETHDRYQNMKPKKTPHLERYFGRVKI